MEENMSQEDNIKVLEGCIESLEQAAIAFCKGMSDIYSDELSRSYKFEQHRMAEYVCLHCLRIISGFNASMSLIKQGYFQEVGVICRSILEFSNNLYPVFETFDENIYVASCPVSKTIICFGSKNAYYA